MRTGRRAAITHRNDPILPVSCMGVPVDDWAALRPVHMAALLEDLRDRGFPVSGLYSPPEGTTNLLLVSTKVLYPYYPQTLASAIWSSQAIRPLPYHLFIFDDDIDVTNMKRSFGPLAHAVTLNATFTSSLPRWEAP